MICFLADKTEPGAWNLAMYKTFADPFNTAGLVIDAKMHDGFVFEVYDVFEGKRIFFDCPGDLYDLLMYVVGRDMGDWGTAAAFYDEWVSFRPLDTRTYRWAPTIANRRRQVRT